MPRWIFNEYNRGLFAGTIFVKRNAAQVWSEAANSPPFCFVLSLQISAVLFGCRAFYLIFSLLNSILKHV